VSVLISFCSFSSVSFSQEARTPDEAPPEEIISNIQSKLTVIGCYSEDITGTLTPKTLSAIESFVEAVEYDSTTPLDAMGLLTLLENSGVATCFDELEVIKLVQVELNRLGCALGRADGIIGRRSIAALRALIENTSIDIQYDPSLFSQISFLNTLKGLNPPVCLTAPLPEPYDIAGVWRSNFSCPNSSSFIGEAEIYRISGGTYRIRYYDEAGVGAGVLSLIGRRVTGTINYRGQRISFNLMLAAGGASLSGTSSNGCMFSGRRTSR
jgi:hypothetical protein